MQTRRIEQRRIHHGDWGNVDFFNSWSGGQAHRDVGFKKR
jgi:hypothetical protein